jgi:hypothetical protein
MSIAFRLFWRMIKGTSNARNNIKGDDLKLGEAGNFEY